MILQALFALYQRRMRDPDPTRRLPALGLEEKEIPYILDIDPDGKLIKLTDTRGGGKKPVGRKYLVPQGLKKSSGVAANLLWDTLEYVLGVDTRGKPARVVEQHAAFRARIRALPEAVRQDAGIIAINRFLDTFDVAQLASDPKWPEVLAANPVLSFRLQDEPNDDLICQRPALAGVIAALAAAEPEDGDGQAMGVCLVTGDFAPIERLHTAIKGVWGAQSSGANIVSFNADAYCSFGNNGRQGCNAPVSTRAAFAYTSALNALLLKDSGQRTQVGDASTVFWAEVGHQLERDIPDAFGEPPKDDPRRGTEAVERILNWLKSGQDVCTDGDKRFYVLGLAPNAARISIRFWETLTLFEVAKRTMEHFDDLRIVGADYEPKYPSLFRLLAACATQGKADNIPPNLGGDVIRAVLRGGPYPATWLGLAVRRCRAEQHVNYLRAAVIKACLNRASRQPNQDKPVGINKNEIDNIKELLDMLDLENKSTAYRLGRLFATLEKIQEEAQPGINAGIRDRFYGAASSTPLSVFTTLLRLHHHHLAKLGKTGFGRRVYFETLIGEIMGAISDFPAHLPLAEQGRFSIGYYHQRQHFFTKTTKAE